MKLREIQSSSTFAWSPLASKGGLLACGSVAGALGDNFDAEATLEIYSLSLEQEGTVMPKLGSVRTHDRFNRITWGLLNSPAEVEYQLQDVYPYGLIAGGLVDGTVQIWDARAIIDSSSGLAAEIATIDNHKGQVKGVEFNPFNQPLLATAAQDGEWCVWNLTDPSQPQNLATGVRGPHNSEIVQISWNKKVSHILAWTSSDGMTVVWDLKSKRQAMSFQDTQNRLRCSAIAWSPDKATDICLANDDDANPVIQFWDLRKAYSPVRVLSGHKQGVLSLSWSPMDSNLLVSCGKDCRTICWNPNTSEILCELPVSNNWVFDVQWSLRIPAILATGSFGDKIMVYSLQDSSPTEPSGEATSEFGIGTPTPASKAIRTAPKWLRRPVGASFGFGGKLVSFGQPPENSKDYKFALRTVVTEQGLVDRCESFEEMLKADQLPQFCGQKLQGSDGYDQKTWSVLKTLLEESPRKKLLDYLGFDAGQIQQEIEERLHPVVEDPFSEDAEEKADTLTVIPPEVLEQLIQRAITVGNFEAAVKCCLHADRMDDALVFASYGGPALWKRTQEAYFQKKANNPFMKVVASIVDNRLPSIVDDFDATSDTAWKNVLAVICTYCKPEELSQLAGRVGDKLTAAGNAASILAYLAAGNLELAVDTWIQHLDQDPKRAQEGLQDFVEKVSIFQRITDKTLTNDQLAQKYTEYAELLSSQGCLAGAKRYLELLKPDCPQKGAALRDRVYRCQAGAGIPPFPPPPFPFIREDIYVPEPEVQEAAAPPVPIPVPTPAPEPVEKPAPEPIPQQLQTQPPFVQPVQPTQPVQPVQPVQPTQPQFPQQPTQPTFPQQLGQPQFPPVPQAQPQFPQGAAVPSQVPSQVQPQFPQVPQAQPQPQPVQPPSTYPQIPSGFPQQQEMPQVPAAVPTPQPQPSPQPQQTMQQQPMQPQQMQYQFPQQSQQAAYPGFSQVPQQSQFGGGWAQSPAVPTPAPSSAGIPPPAQAQVPSPVAPPPAGQMPPAAPLQPFGNVMSTPPVPTTSTPTSGVGTPAAMGTPTSSPAGINLATIPPQWQPMVTNLLGAFSRLGLVNAADQKKRPPVEKALVSLCAKLTNNEISPEVGNLMLRFSQVCESDGHEAKEIARKLTDAHWDQFKAFKDLKFLSK